MHLQFKFHDFVDSNFKIALKRSLLGYESCYFGYQKEEVG